jgi:hypothetical protein
MHENVVDAMRDMPKLEPGVVDYEADDEAEDSQADEDDEEL